MIILITVSTAVCVSLLNVLLVVSHNEMKQQLISLLLLVLLVVSPHEMVCQLISLLLLLLQVVSHCEMVHQLISLLLLLVLAVSHCERLQQLVIYMTQFIRCSMAIHRNITEITFTQACTRIHISGIQYNSRTQLFIFSFAHTLRCSLAQFIVSILM